jgi:hypothetical protein
MSNAALAQMRSPTAAANVAQAKQLAKSKKGGLLHFVQARNPRWATTGFMTPDLALVSRQVLRHHGLSAHIHTTSNGSFVHYGMMHWATKGATTDRNAANAAAAQLRALGLSARVVTRPVKN